MKQAHDEILEKWLDEEIQSMSVAKNQYIVGYRDALRDVKDKLEELWKVEERKAF